MDRFLRPERFDGRPSNSPVEWNHWFRTFTNFLETIVDKNPDKLNTLINYVSPTVYNYIADAATYDDAIATLTAIFVKTKNEIFARHLLATRHQQTGESVDDYLQALLLLSKDCNYKAVTAELYCQESIRDALISGLNSSIIRQRLRENNTLSLEEADSLS